MVNLKNIKAAISQWRASVDTLESALEQKLQRLSWLQEAPPTREELADMVIEAMSRHGDTDFHHFLDHKLGTVISNPLIAARPEWRPGILGGIDSPNVLSPFCLFHLLKEPLGSAIRAAILAWDGLPESGLPRAEREAEVLILEHDVKKLREKIEAERQAAKAAGVTISSLHQRGRLPARPRDLK